MWPKRLVGTAEIAGAEESDLDGERKLAGFYPVVELFLQAVVSSTETCIECPLVSIRVGTDTDITVVDTACKRFLEYLV